MKTNYAFCLLCAVIVGFSPPVKAEGRERRTEVGARQNNQAERVHQGIKNGTISSSEKSNLQSQEKNIQQQIKSDRAANGGNLTNKEKKQINQEQNDLSKQIYKDKHNESGSKSGNSSSSSSSSSKGQEGTQNRGDQKTGGSDGHGWRSEGRTEVGARQNNQAERVQQGINNGTISAGEKSSLKSQGKNIQQQIKSDRAANGGNLTNKEKKQINQEQNDLSKQIYKDKHNEGRSGSSSSSTSGPNSSGSPGSSSTTQ